MLNCFCVVHVVHAALRAGMQSAGVVVGDPHTMVGLGDLLTLRYGGVEKGAEEVGRRRGVVGEGCGGVRTRRGAWGTGKGVEGVRTRSVGAWGGVGKGWRQAGRCVWKGVGAGEGGV